VSVCFVRVIVRALETSTMRQLWDVALQRKKVIIIRGLEL